jgi:hypothetical protein
MLERTTFSVVGDVKETLSHEDAAIQTLLKVKNKTMLA